MRQALALAREAFDAGEVPVGAVVIRQTQSGFLPARLEDDPTFKAQNHVHSETAGRGRNRSRDTTDMTAHAELEAIRHAARSLGRAHLTDCTLVVTLEPCLMCLGAALEARIPRIVYAAANPKNGALGGVLDATRGHWNHRFSVRAGVRAKDSADLLSAFFANLR